VVGLNFDSNDVDEVELLQSSLQTANGRANQLQRANELLETHVKRLMVVVADAESRQAAAATDAKQLTTEQNLERQCQLHEISEMKQQVI